MTEFFQSLDPNRVKDEQGQTFASDRLRNIGVVHLFDDVWYSETYPEFIVKDAHNVMRADINQYPELLVLCRVLCAYEDRGLHVRVSKKHLQRIGALAPSDWGTINLRLFRDTLLRRYVGIQRREMPRLVQLCVETVIATRDLVDLICGHVDVDDALMSWC